MKRICFLSDQRDETWSAAFTDHEEMIQALETRDGRRLPAAMVDHLSKTWDRIKNAI